MLGQIDWLCLYLLHLQLPVPQVLGQLTSVGEISPEAWLGRWRELRLCTDTYYVIVIEDTDLRRVVGEQYILSRCPNFRGILWALLNFAEVLGSLTALHR